MQTRPCDVRPNADQDKYSLALQDSFGRWYGLDVLLNQIYPKTTNASEPLQKVVFNSFHQGRGFDRFQPEQYGYFHSRNLWSTTPGKMHATQLFRWGNGLQEADFNMPNTGGVTWKRLVGAQRYLDISFSASASYTANRMILLVRKGVPAGTTGSPGTLTAEICSNSSGDPGSVLETVTLAASAVDVVSEYYEWTISEALTSGTTYHVKVYGASTDRDNACWEVGCDPNTAGKKSSNNSTWTATTFSPYYRVTNRIGRTFQPFIWDGALYLVSIYADGTTASKLYINGVRGRAVGAQTSTTLKDTGHGTYGATNWTANRFANCYVRIIRGTGQGQVRLISSNDADTLTVSTAWDITPVASDSEYVVYACDWFVEIGTTGLGVVTGTPAISNGIVYFPQGDSTNIRIMQMDYTDADDHAFDSESTNTNKAYFLATGFDSALGQPVVWRANRAITVGTPAAKKISVSWASASPAGVPVTFGTDLTFNPSILVGDNTNLITNIYFHENNMYVLKEDGPFIIQNNQPVQVKLGTERTPDVDNGRAACTAADKNLYIGFQNDVFLITGGGAYSTGMKNNLPSTLSGYVADLCAAEGWIFAAVNGGSPGSGRASSIMKYSLDTKSWSEQLRGTNTGEPMRAVQWQNCPETRPRLWAELSGDMVFQEFPLNGIRPYDDSGQKYQHETLVILPTIDLLTTDYKYYSVLTVTSQGLASEDDTETGNEIVVEYQTDNDVGQFSTWYHAGYIRSSPSGSVEIRQGRKRSLRIRLRLLSSQASDPVIVETVSLTLFSRNRLAHEWQMFFELIADDEEQPPLELIKWLREAAQTSDTLTMYSTNPLMDDRLVTMADEPRQWLQEWDPNNEELEGKLSLTLSEVV